MSKELRNQLQRDLASLESMEGGDVEKQREAINARLAELGDEPAAADAEVDPWDGINITAAARARADELGLTAENFKRRRASGKSGFVVGDVDRIHEALGKEEPDGDE